MKLTLDGEPPVGGLFGIFMTLFVWRYDRVATLVSEREVVVRRMWGETRVPVAEVSGVEDPGRWGTTVRLHRHGAEPMTLPYVQPPDVPALRDRLGVAVVPRSSPG